MGDVTRRCRFRPYLSGPTFSLTMWDTHRLDWRGCTELGYRLVMHSGRKRTVLFEGEDFGPSPMHAIDSDDTVAALMDFLTLRPGDTDADYFNGYSEVQRAFCDQHAEMLACEVGNRFGW